MLKASQALLETHITHVSTYLTLVCNYTFLLHTMVDVVLGMFIER